MTTTNFNRGLMIALLVASVPRAVHSSCVSTSPTGSSFSNTNTVHVTNNTGQAFLSSPISSGMGMWNSGCNGISGSKYPSFSSADGQLNLNIAFSSGHEDGKHCGGGTRYCPSLYDPSTDTITFYGQYGDPTNPSSLLAVDDTTLDRLVAHEIGHSLGLADGSCDHGIMTIPVNFDSAIQTDECSVADSANHVPYEGTVNEGCSSLIDCHQSPIIIDLNGDGYRLTDVAGGVNFDLDGDGVLERVAWTSANSDEAFLWRDLNGNGIVDNGREMFGEAMAANGFEALRAGDSISEGDVVSGGDGNGVLNASDRIWPELRLWIDRDHNGICTPDEVESLASAGIVELDLSYTAAGRKDRAGNEFRFVSKMTRLNPGGQARQSNFYDVYLGVE